MKVLGASREIRLRDVAIAMSALAGGVLTVYFIMHRPPAAARRAAVAASSPSEIEDTQAVAVYPSPHEVASRAPSPEAPIANVGEFRPVYYPRDPAEWQGMLVEMTFRAFCEASAGCGLAAACTDGKCGPCTRDRDCAGSEACVLDHCVLRDNVQCTSRRDCVGEDALCVLTGYSSDTRGNSDMRSECLIPKGGQELPHDGQLVEGTMATPSSVNLSELAESVRMHASGSGTPSK
jgi:hypothetical protein